MHGDKSQRFISAERRTDTESSATGHRRPVNSLRLNRRWTGYLTSIDKADTDARRREIDRQAVEEDEA